MELNGCRVLITGGASGIGAAAAHLLAERGAAAVSLLDLAGSSGRQVAASLRADFPSCDAAFLVCDLTDPAAQRAAFEAHWARTGGADVVMLNAGVAETASFLAQSGDHTAQWRRVVDVNFTCVVDAARLAVQRWQAEAGGLAPRVLLVTASAAAFFPLAGGEAYSAAKAGAVSLVRSLAPLHSRGIRAVALCPAFTETPFIPDELRRRLRADPPLLSARAVAAAALFCICDASNAGAAYFVPQAGAARYWRFPPVDIGASAAAAPKSAAAGPAPQPPRRLAAWASSNLPERNSVLEVVALSSDFRAATSLGSRPLAARPRPGHALVRRAWAGVNASDINMTSGRYFAGKKEPFVPFVPGFESVGVIAALADGEEGHPPAGGWRVGDQVGCITYGGYACYAEEPLSALLPCPCSPMGVALLTSGLTASVALEQALRLTSRDTLLVTAAAGGAGQFACALGIAAGARVVAVCGGEIKAARMRDMGCHAVIDHRTEPDMRAALACHRPTAAFESVGGDLLDAVLDSMAVRGRLCIIGAISRYADGWAGGAHAGLTDKLLSKSVACVGFFLPHYTQHFRRHLAALTARLAAGQLRGVAVDEQQFVGLSAAADAVDRLHSGASSGKVVLQVATSPPPCGPESRL